MTLRWIEGFEAWASGNYDLITNYGFAQKYTLCAGNFTGVAGRINGTAASSQSAYFLAGPFTSQSTWYVGRAFWRNGTNASGGYPTIGFLDNTATTPALQVYVSATNGASGTMSIYNGNGTILGTGSTIMSIDTWYYLEFSATIDSSTGSATLMINGVTEISLSGVNTQNTVNATANLIEFQGNYAWTEYIDDIYICDSTGSNNNTFLGDNHIEALIPSGAGNTTDFSIFGNANNWQNVDQVPSDGDTTYNYSSVTNDLDLFTHNAVSAITTNVKGVQMNAVMRKDNTGSKIVSPIMYSGSTTGVGAAKIVSDTYTTAPSVFETDPDTSSLWTISGVNNSQIGYKIIS